MSCNSRSSGDLSNLEKELYLLIVKFLSTGLCQNAAEVLKQEIEQHQLLPRRLDWQGETHTRSFNDIGPLVSHVSDDHLLKICACISPILDKEIPPAVPGLTSLFGVGRQSLLRTKDALKKLRYNVDYLSVRKYGTPLHPPITAQASYPPNITKVLLAREYSGPISSRHVFSTKTFTRLQPFRRILGHLSSVYCVLFDRTGKYIFTGADDLLVKIWSATDGRLLASLRGHSAEITDMAVNHENTLLAAGSCDKTIRVWSIETTAPVAILCSHTAMVTSLQFCPYPKAAVQFLVSTGNDGCICFWSWNSRTRTFNERPMKFTERNKPGAQMICSSFSSGGLLLATGSTDHNIRVFNIAGVNGPEKILEKEVHTDRVDSIQFSNLDCRYISGSKDGTALVWKYEKQTWSHITLKMTTKLPGQPEEVEDSKVKLRVTMVGWSLDDSMVITAVSDCSVKVWNSRTGSLCYILKGHEDEVFVLESHPTDSRILLSSGHDGKIMLWDLGTGLIIKQHNNLIEGQGYGAVFDCKFSPDGQMLASTDSHGHLSIYGFGVNDRYKKVPEEQFFHTDYRPLIRDIHHHILDEQTQTPPHLLPPPFLVDIDGNPYPPNLQRLVPGRENCNDSQLVPYVSMAPEGEEPMRNDDDIDRPTIDDMIQRLQQEQQHDDPQEPENPEQSSAARLLSPSHSSHRSPQVGNSSRNLPNSLSPRSAQRAQAGHSRVGMRGSGDVEGVRQSVGNWHSRGNQSDVPSWVRRLIVKPLTPSLAESYLRRRYRVAGNELSFFNREKRRPPIPDPSKILHNGETNTQQKGSSRRDRFTRIGLRSRRLLARRSSPFGEDFENPEAVNSTSSSDTETEEDHSDDASSVSEHSDWTADARVNDSDRPNLRSSKPSTSTGTSSRPRRHHMSPDNNNSDDDNEQSDDKNHKRNPQEKSKKKSKKNKNIDNNNKKGPRRKLPERYRPPEWLTDVMPHKAPYVPQIGDEVVYFRQGHELYVHAVKKAHLYEIFMRNQPWRQMNLREQEAAKIVDISFENRPPRLCCLKLALLNPASDQNETFVVKYHDMADVVDFIVLRQNFDQASYNDWKPGDRFRAAIDKAWWLGTVKDHRPFDGRFPDSKFQCYVVKWDNGEKEHMSPWDFEKVDPERMPGEHGGSVPITPEERLAMMYVPERNEWSSYGLEYDIDRIARGFTRIMELHVAANLIAPVDLNKYPSYAIVVEYPMDLGTIRSRLQNRYYRRLDAVKFDVQYIEKNADKFNEAGTPITKQAKCVVDLCLRFIKSPNCHDPMILYREMMEAKRSQDSQSELDVLCSESDSDEENPSSSQMKRRKRRESIMHTNKRLKPANLKYSSDTWKQQCAALIEQMFQAEDSTPFRQPVNLIDYPDYRNIVDNLMDLSAAKEKLEINQYGSPMDFCRDMRLMFQNSRNYNTNKKSGIYSMTIRLSAFFEEQIRSINSDYRSLVKYEEKLRNNQFVSDRRAPFSVVGTSSSERQQDYSAPGPSRVSQRNVTRGMKKEIHSRSGKLSKTRSRKSKISRNRPLTNGVSKSNKPRNSAESSRQRSNRAADSCSTNSKKREKPIKEAETESEEEKPDFEENSNFDEDDDDEDYQDRVMHQKKKRRYQVPDTGFQQKLRPRTPHHSQRLHHHTRATSALLSQTAVMSTRNMHSNSSPDHRTLRDRSRPHIHKLSSALRNNSNQLSATLRLRNRQATANHNPKTSSEESDSDQTVNEEDEASSTNSNAQSTSKTNNSSHTSENGGSKHSSDTETESQNSSQENNHSDDENDRQGRRSTRATTRDNTKATRSALTELQKPTRKQKRDARMQTRNRGQRTVRYIEHSNDEDSNEYQSSDFETAEPILSFSSRGRLRKLTSRALHSSE